MKQFFTVLLVVAASACAFAESRTTTYSYDAFGNVQTVTDGRWGGRGWGAGRWVPERYLRPGDFDVNNPKLRPENPRDWCYYGHDKCIWQCYQDQKNNSECVDEKALNKCVRQCDRELGNCLGKLPWTDLPEGDI
jgi:hypothetical protein